MTVRKYLLPTLILAALLSFLSFLSACEPDFFNDQGDTDIGDSAIVYGYDPGGSDGNGGDLNYTYGGGTISQAWTMTPNDSSITPNNTFAAKTIINPAYKPPGTQPGCQCSDKCFQLTDQSFVSGDPSVTSVPSAAFNSESNENFCEACGAVPTIVLNGVSVSSSQASCMKAIHACPDPQPFYSQGAKQLGEYQKASGACLAAIKASESDFPSDCLVTRQKASWPQTVAEPGTVLHPAGLECCGCYAQNGPTPEVLGLTQLVATNFGRHASGVVGADGNTRARWCIPDENGNLSNAACLNLCSYFKMGVGTSPGGVTPDPTCYMGYANMVSISPQQSEVVTWLGGDSVGFTPTNMHNFNSCEGGYTKGCCESMHLPTYSNVAYGCGQSFHLMAQALDSDTHDPVWTDDGVIDNGFRYVWITDTPSEGSKAPSVAFDLPCIDSTLSDPEKGIYKGTFYLNPYFIASANGSKCLGVDDPTSNKPTAQPTAYATLEAMQLSCTNTESGGKCDGTDALPACPAVSGTDKGLTAFRDSTSSGLNIGNVTKLSYILTSLKLNEPNLVFVATDDVKSGGACWPSS